MIDRDLKAWLDSHIDNEKGKISRRAQRPTLERMKTLVKSMGDPQNEVPTIHITGTNGKTSTTRITESLLREKGMFTGLICSPHLSEMNERICLDGSPCSDLQLETSLNFVKQIENSFPEVLSDLPSYFEVFVAAAFELFHQEAIDVAAVEVGMGGLFDATNICNSKVGVITNVELDHMEFLGNTREKIAIEKAGIIKPGSSVAIGEPDRSINQIFIEKAKEVGSNPYVVGNDFELISNEQAVGGRLLSFSTPYSEYRDMFLPLFGAHQGFNATIAVVACELFFEAPLGEEIVSEGFFKARSPGRMEIVDRDPLIILDGAHNVAGAQTFKKAFDEEFERSRRIYVLGLTKEKDATAMVNSFSIEDDDIVIATAVNLPRAMPVHELARAIREAGVETVIESEDPKSAIEHARSLAFDDDHIIVTGSLYLVGEIRSLLV